MNSTYAEALCEAPVDALTDALCQINTNVDNLVYCLNSFYLVISGTLVFVMQAGFAMLCAGSVRQKNAKNIMLKNLLDASFGAIGFYTLGYAFAFGGTVGEKVTFIGNGNFALKDVDGYAFFFFQYAFAASAATIVAGTVAERCKMSAYICYSFFLSAFVYPVVAHSIWDVRGVLSPFRIDGAPIRGSGVVDFAGSGIVHFTGGVTALVAAIILGPRKGRFYDADGNKLPVPVTFEPHNVSLQILGTFLLWFGWYGFNPGSTLGLIVAGTPLAKASAHCAVTTTLSAASGAISGVFFDSIMDSMTSGEVSYDLTMAMNGCLAGLVGITAGCATVEPWAAIMIGLISGVVYWAASKTLIALRIDDAVDAIPVHCANGAWGLIAAGLFSKRELMTQAAYSTTSPQGWLMNWGEGSGDANLLLAQLIAILFIATWVTVLMFPFFYALNMVGMFRVDELEEDVGLDISHHRGGAYDLAAPEKDHVEELMEIRASRHGKVEIPQESSKPDEY